MPPSDTVVQRCDLCYTHTLTVSMKINQMNVKSFWHHIEHMSVNRISLGKVYEETCPDGVCVCWSGERKSVYWAHAVGKEATAIYRMFLSFRYDLVWAAQVSVFRLSAPYSALSSYCEKFSAKLVRTHIQHTRTHADTQRTHTQLTAQINRIRWTWVQMVICWMCFSACECESVREIKVSSRFEWIKWSLNITLNHLKCHLTVNSPANIKYTLRMRLAELSAACGARKWKRR